MQQLLLYGELVCAATHETDISGKEKQRAETILERMALEGNKDVYQILTSPLSIYKYIYISQPAEIQRCMNFAEKLTRF